MSNRKTAISRRASAKSTARKSAAKAAVSVAKLAATGRVKVTVHAKPGATTASRAKLLAKAMPGWRVINEEEVLRQRAQRPTRQGRADAVSPPLRAMKQKVMGGKGAASDGAVDSLTADDEVSSADKSTDVVTVESSAGDRKERKVVGVRDGKVVWRQG